MRSSVSWGIGALALVVGGVLTVLDLTDDDVRLFFYTHNWTNQVVGSAMLVVATYAVVERLLSRRQGRMWREGAYLPLQSYSEKIFLLLVVGERNLAGNHLRAAGYDAQDLEKLTSQLREEGAALRTLLAVNPHMVGALPAFVDLHEHVVAWDGRRKHAWGDRDLETMLHERVGGDRAALGNIKRLYRVFHDAWTRIYFER